ncbi:uncharacterized protein LOC110374573 [Helicoverpa armigera]|uniref:uncharacterized protein LOC110374573 n=1 Tax=Helicoverpa armigera TaxID=29058 RepID=UPI000B3A6D15|nr:uncharacterized protein LOC110374573 [Helicoverpa armigera]PZC86651.1 hypothetical protein B5X24_HaOG206212 [Helicoverpa armigera]
MDPIKLASGDNKIAITSRQVYDTKAYEAEDDKQSPNCDEVQTESDIEKVGQSDVTPQMIDDNEAKMKERIAQCKNIIESLKIELNEEKAKLEKQSLKSCHRLSESPSKCTTSHQCVSSSNAFAGDLTYNTNLYRECVDSKLTCDENLIEYEKQLQKYQNTLNMAQIEKKNAIRKQMLAKAYRLKLLEVENQCNIELLRVKQSLQCLEPLQMIASKWKTNTDEMYDVNSFELIPRYPELNANSSSDITSYELEIKTATERIENVAKEDSVFSD